MNKRANGILILIVILFYCMNQNFKLVVKTRILRLFMMGYFNDVLCGLGFMAYCNIVSNKNQIVQLYKILLVLIITGFFWEFVTPLYRQDSVTDGFDILAYIVGGIGYWLLYKICRFCSGKLSAIQARKK